LNIYEDLNNLSITEPVATIGTFDGIHLGHRKIIKRINTLAKQINGQSVLITLWPPPRVVFSRPGEKITYLTPLKEKLELLDSLGVDNVLIIPFSKKYALTPYVEFIRHVLVEKLRIKYMVVGFNNAFGRNREGTFEKLTETAAKYHFTVEQLTPEETDNMYISSSLIRDRLDAGDVSEAALMLGDYYSLGGVVVEGRKVGKSLGFPTANIQPGDPDKRIPANGVYAVQVEYGGKIHQGMMNIGVRPTFKGLDHQRIPEVHIFDFHSSVYGEYLKIRFIKRIREEIAFDGKEQLIRQIQKDKDQIMMYFASNNTG